MKEICKNENKIIIKWLGHSCFKITKGEYSIVLDPFEPGSVPGLKPINENANLVLCSHGHHDHAYTDAVKITPASSSPFTVTEIKTFHDDKNGSLRGPNIIHLIESDGVKIVHFGDIGCQLTEEQAEILKNADCAMIPVGGHYTVDAVGAKQIINAINPKLVIPMHYRSETFGFDVLAPVQEYLEICGRWIRVDSDSIEIGSDEHKYTAVLTYKE